MGTIFILGPIALGLLVVALVRAFDQRQTDQPEQQTAVMREYRRRRFQHFVGYLVLVLVSFTVTGIIVLGNSTSVELARSGTLWLMLPIIFVYGVYEWMIWRCPQCRTYLGRNIDPQHCPSCGVQLR